MENISEVFQKEKRKKVCEETELYKYWVLTTIYRL